jgi:Protein of unknown function (DUF3347)
MKKAFIFLLLAVAAFAAYWFLIRKTDNLHSGEKQAAMAIKKHSQKFNTSVANMMTAYFAMQNAFVDADTLKAKESCNKFIALADSVDFNELKDDSVQIVQNAKQFFTDAKANASSLLTQKEIIEMRKDFSMISESLYPAFKSINYTGATIYWQNCPMAFGEDKPANWISNTKEIMNPYMGKNHPEFKGTMLHCGAVKETLEGK